MTTLLLTHPARLDHQTPLWHPERQDRTRAIESALEAECFAWLAREQATPAAREVIALVHPEPYVQGLIDAAPLEGLVAIDEDTSLSPGTLEAALCSAGAAVQAVDEVVVGKVNNAFSAMRPPGHHAERAKAMGFCFFNNAAIAARYAQNAHSAEHVAIVDWD